MTFQSESSESAAHTTFGNYSLKMEICEFICIL